MTNQQHPITPPPELMQQWAAEYWNDPGEPIGNGEKYIATQAARWGADQELEACCKTLQDIWDNEDLVTLSDVLRWLRAARRPKPPSLKEQALKALEVEDDSMPLRSLERSERFDTIRRALEALDD